MGNSDWLRPVPATDHGATFCMFRLISTTQISRCDFERAKFFTSNQNPQSAVELFIIAKDDGDDEGEEEELFSTRRRLDGAAALLLENSSEKCCEHLRESKGARHYGCEDVMGLDMKDEERSFCQDSQELGISGLTISCNISSLLDLDPLP